MKYLKAPLRFTYKTVNGVNIPTDVYIPHNAEPAPVLIMIHGGAFMLGHAGMNNKDQILDCLDRGWIVVAIEHRLCPGVNVLEGPMTDIRDALRWVQTGELAKVLQGQGVANVSPDAGRVMVMGTSSGGHLALCTAWDVPKKPLAILDFYGAKHFGDPSWYEPLASMPVDRFPAPSSEEEISVRAESTIFVGGVSLEGQADSSSPSNPKSRLGFALHQISTGNVIKTIWPQAPQHLQAIDPMLNVSSEFPPTAIVHGTADDMIPMHLSKAFEQVLIDHHVETEFFEVEGEKHTFCGQMEKGSKTWDTQRKGFDFLERILKQSYVR